VTEKLETYFLMLHLSMVIHGLKNHQQISQILCSKLRYIYIKVFWPGTGKGEALIKRRHRRSQGSENE
jgi:hypothetical protein